MTDQEVKAFLDLFEVLGRSVADQRALVTIARDAGIQDLEERLEKVRGSARYQLIVRDYEIAARKFLVDHTAQALAELLAKLNAGKPEN